jgi:hypothetical protein
MQSWGAQREVEKPKPMKHERQISVSQLPEAKQDEAMASVDEATEKYAQVEVGGCGLHICFIDGEWQVWLNTEDATFTGLCVSAGPTRQAAIADAVATLEAAVAHLQQPVLG